MTVFMSIPSFVFNLFCRPLEEHCICEEVLEIEKFEISESALPDHAIELRIALTFNESKI